MLIKHNNQGRPFKDQYPNDNYEDLTYLYASMAA